MELVIVFGPSAVGKMTVGRAICELTGFKLFHNHMSIEPILAIFPFGRRRSGGWSTSCANGSSRRP